MDAAARNRVKRCKEEGRCCACLLPLDGRVVRGCHERCYKATFRHIEAGNTTEQERVDAGKLLPQAAGRPVTSPVSLDILGIKTK